MIAGYKVTALRDVCIKAQVAKAYTQWSATTYHVVDVVEFVEFKAGEIREDISHVFGIVFAGSLPVNSNENICDKGVLRSIQNLPRNEGESKSFEEAIVIEATTNHF